jgi:4'-phosphopantetheinyl transferase
MNSARDWQRPRGQTPLERGDAHVWRVRLDTAVFDEADGGSILTADERLRLARFRFQRDAVRFGTCRLVLRCILGRYLDKPPGSVRIAADDFGKPYLSGEGAHIRFNVAHSGEFALVGVTCNREIGVDIEHVKPELPWQEIAPTVFSDREIEAIYALEPARQRRAFFQCWTLKEALVKAKGQGLSLPLREFTVPVMPSPEDDPFTLSDPMQSEPWALRPLFPNIEYAGAIATEGNPDTLRLFQWTDSLTRTGLGSL